MDIPQTCLLTREELQNRLTGLNGMRHHAFGTTFSKTLLALLEP